MSLESRGGGWFDFQKSGTYRRHNLAWACYEAVSGGGCKLVQVEQGEEVNGSEVAVPGGLTANAGSGADVGSE